MTTETITAEEIAAESPPISTPPAELSKESAPSTTNGPAIDPNEPVTPKSSPAEFAPPAKERDAIGRSFDSTKFHPRKDSAGRWINKNAGRKPASPAAAEQSGRSFVPPDAPPAGARAPGSPDRYDVAAELYCRSGYAIADMLFASGGEWFPENDGEHVALKSAAAGYLRFKGCEDLPPGLTLLLAVGIYAAPRFAKPRTAARIRSTLALLRRGAPAEVGPGPLELHVNGQPVDAPAPDRVGTNNPPSTARGMVAGGIGPA